MKTKLPVGKQGITGMSAKVQTKLVALAKLVEEMDYPRVEVAARELLKLLPTHAYVLKALSFGLIGQAEFDLSIPVLEKAIRLAPRDAELHNNLGIALSAMMRWDEALACFDNALAHDPGDAEIWKNKGVAFNQINQWNDAIACFAKGIEVFPGDYDEAIDLLAVALLNAGRNEEAFACFTELSDSSPDNAHYLGGLLRAGLRQCQWDGLTLKIARLSRLTGDFEQLAVAPFDALAIPGLTAPELKRIALAHIGNRIPDGVFKLPGMAAGRELSSVTNRRIRVGYLSYDFKNHPVAYVIPHVLELHDRDRFEVFGYSMGPDDESDIRHRIKQAFDHFVDIRPLGVRSSAKKIFDDGIDILVDLQGWTLGERAGVLALRPAPVQVGWLGFAGTMGSDRLADYLIGDSIVTPEEHQPYYAERIVRMPHCYLPMDATRSNPTPPRRSDVGLPEEAFVFCSLNNAYKFNPGVFDVWCEILRATPGSCLWMNRPFGKGADNLLHEAAARGVTAERIVFATYVDSRTEYLARLQLADLALDPSPYTSHSSGMDVLWAGVPMVTFLGDTFAGRVGASLLTAAGLPECITQSWQDYRRLCIALCRQPERYRQLRHRLKANRATAPLFDMELFTRDLESMFVRMREGDLKLVRSSS